ncbi:FtsK/SpoIIIE domain-containing protein [Glycomyces buryatensis]|uniref:Cell division protein FtsK n=1 Tax=Glycomyces buryatensis TaxID=2570927 RepID=A0A4S8QQI8_9ACTN|nr:FtsK/SpoIIIE domain-containing protein [Glycomyces buryatensis]THV42984.1 cell division protein FtsK [Glycomyces buryatensis]
MPGFRTALANAAAGCDVAAARLEAAGRRLGEAAFQTPVDPALLAAERQISDAAAASAAQLRTDPELLHAGQVVLHEGLRFPLLVPFGASGHLATSVDAREEGVAALVRGAVLHLLAHREPGRLRVVGVDITTLGATFAPLRPLADAGVIEAVATDARGAADAVTAAETQVAEHIAGRRDDRLLLAIASLGQAPKSLIDRVDALARSGLAHGVTVLACGLPDLPQATVMHAVAGHVEVSNPPSAPISRGERLAAPVAWPEASDPSYLAGEAQRLAERARAAATLTFADLIPAAPESGDPSDGLEVLIGRDAAGPVRLRFDDATPHWLIGGRTGGGKTVFLLDVLYGLASRYAPSDLALFLLDFKEGVSFTEFIPTERDTTYIPHARAVGVESDREYGLAVLRTLNEEMTRRSTVMKRYGVASFAALRRHESFPRIVCVADEFQVLLAGNDRVASEAVALLENLARKGRSYGVHLVLASQTISGIEALWAKKDSIFGQFPLRVALPGARTVLEHNNDAAGRISLGQVVINPEGGAAGADRVARFPNSDTEIMLRLREQLRVSHADSGPPRVFFGYLPVHFEQTLPGERQASRALLGREVSLRLDAAGVDLDRRPGRHLAILGSDHVGGETLEAAAASLAAKAPPGQSLWGVDFTGHANLQDISYRIRPEEFAAKLAEVPDDTLILGWGLDAASLDMKGQKALRDLLRTGPARGVHFLGWWRIYRRFLDDIGGTSGREDVACALVLNLPGGELTSHFGQQFQHWSPRSGRALLIDRHADTGGGKLIVPFSRPDTDGDLPGQTPRSGATEREFS